MCQLVLVLLHSPNFMSALHLHTYAMKQLQGPLHSRRDFDHFKWKLNEQTVWSTSQSLGDVNGQFTAAPPTCLGDTFTFRCTVTGDRSGLTIWRVGGSSECTLVHRSTSSSICGPDDTFTAVFGAGFGTHGPSFISTLSGILTPAMNGALIECFGPGLARDAENRVGDSILQTLGLFLCD